MAYYEKQGWENQNFWYGCQSNFVPGITACNAFQPKEKKHFPTSVKDRVGAWFIRPLENFSAEDAFACLMMILPLIEKYLRFKLRINDEITQLKFTKGGKLCKELGFFLSISSDEAFQFWSIFRNGLLHRATIDAALPYALHPDTNVKPVVLQNGIIHVYIWVLRDVVVKALKSSDNAMWTKERFPLPEIFHEYS